MRIFAAVWAAIKTVFAAIGHGFSVLWSKSRIAGVALLIVLVGVLVVGLDTAFTSGKIYKGVMVGDVDLSHMTVDQASEAILASYTPRLFATSVYIFADEETAQSADIELKMIEDNALAEQISFEEAQANKKLWITSAQALEAALPARELAEEAFLVGRETGFLDRIKAGFGSISIPVYANFNETLLGNLISDINATLGDPVIDYGIEMDDEGRAHVTEGKTGYLLNNEEFAARINDELLADESSIVGFVANVEYTPYKIDEAAATLTCDAINAVMPQSVSFNSAGDTILFTRSTLGGWIGTEVVDSEGKSVLLPVIDRDAASPSILAEVNQASLGSSADISFIEEGGTIYVQPDGEVSIPDIEKSLSTLESSLFGEFRETLQVPSAPDIPEIPIDTEMYSGRLSVDDALSYGLVSRFSIFTTQYTNTSSTANRTFNIHLAADRISNSIATADGGQWSFNEIAGACDESNGFREAGVIESGEYTTGIGGGICQVATTVFNAVYEAGLPVKERYNHTLYSASYPAGRDAAIAYPTLDLKWVNDTSSDILLRTSHTDTSITVALIGKSPGREVSTETGDWKEGAKYSTKFELDESLGADASYIKTAGTNGMEITVTRTVRDSNGNVLIKDTFKSTYSPIDRVIAYGPGTDMTVLKNKYSDKPKTSPQSNGQSSSDVASTGSSSSKSPSASSSASSEAGRNDSENDASTSTDTPAEA